MLPVVLRNLQEENKCWLNSVLQGLKGSPSFRNFVFAKIRGRSLIGDENNPEIWKDAMTISFWDSFLCNDLRDGKREFIKRPREKTVFRPGFFGEANYGHTRFCCLDFPWDIRRFGFLDRFEIKSQNKMQELGDAIKTLDQAFQFSASKVIINITPGGLEEVPPTVEVPLAQISKWANSSSQSIKS